MTEKMKHALREAIAISEMEGLLFTQEEIETVEKILEGKMTLKEYCCMIQAHCEEN